MDARLRWAGVHKKWNDSLYMHVCVYIYEVQGRWRYVENTWRGALATHRADATPDCRARDRGASVNRLYTNPLLRYNYFRFRETNVRYIGILLLVSVSTILPQSACMLNTPQPTRSHLSYANGAQFHKYWSGLKLAVMVNFGNPIFQFPLHTSTLYT